MDPGIPANFPLFIKEIPQHTANEGYDKPYQYRPWKSRIPERIRGIKHDREKRIKPGMVCSPEPFTIHFYPIHASAKHTKA